MNVRRALTVCASALVAVAAFAPGASADVAVSGGTLDFDPTGAPTIGDFSPVTLNGTPQLTSLTIDPFTIVDATGSGSGWNVLLTVADLVNGGDTIAASNVSMSAPVVAGAGLSSLTGVTGFATTGALAGGEKMVVASPTNGMGTYLVSPLILKLTVPVTAQAGTYLSTATIAVVSGP